MAGSRGTRLPMRGIDCISATVYGWRGASISRCVGAFSQAVPAYITRTSSEISEITPRSWVMNCTDMCRRSCSCWISSRICPWMVTSSAVVGSSAIRNSGSQDSAIAIMARWRMPPESWCG